MNTCKKPNCDCIEQQAKKDGVDIYSVKGGYQCLYGDNSANEVEKSANKSKDSSPIEQTPSDLVNKGKDWAGVGEQVLKAMEGFIPFVIYQTLIRIITECIY